MLNHFRLSNYILILNKFVFLFLNIGESNDSVLEPESDCIKCSFSSDSVFNLSKRVLSKTKTRF